MVSSCRRFDFPALSMMCATVDRRPCFGSSRFVPVSWSVVVSFRIGVVFVGVVSGSCASGLFGCCPFLVSVGR